jgi:hypothetical protein
MPSWRALDCSRADGACIYVCLAKHLVVSLSFCFRRRLTSRVHRVASASIAA